MSSNRSRNSATAASGRAVRCLRLMRPRYRRLDALDEWQTIVDDLRHRCPGCKKPLEMLEEL